MAIRIIREDGDEILRKISRTVEVVNDRIRIILDDMVETMYESNGVGLAAPQVGILKRIVVIDVGEGIIELINPEILSQDGEQEELEGCLSIPGVFGYVKRPLKLKVKALDRNGKVITIEAEEFLARVISHETDHLNGILFKDKVIRYATSEELNR